MNVRKCFRFLLLVCAMLCCLQNLLSLLPTSFFLWCLNCSYLYFAFITYFLYLRWLVAFNILHKYHPLGYFLAVFQASIRQKNATSEFCLYHPKLSFTLDNLEIPLAMPHSFYSLFFVWSLHSRLLPWGAQFDCNLFSILQLRVLVCAPVHQPMTSSARAFKQMLCFFLGCHHAPTIAGETACLPA